ncbi:hypothetical protein RDWZM_003794 [Blomia tropicalis]|uniref:Uncharacterized protein n=1 Tax=Blomia tropicalis TaxID=40697 RepID=A0A9Q0RSW2_BLOTA|nr:hypothetical protein RDWZM_003794 [Blomia tropicalis]
MSESNCQTTDTMNGDMVTICDHSELIGLFLKHDQSLETYVDVVQPLQSIEPDIGSSGSGSKRDKLSMENFAFFSNYGNCDRISRRRRCYELNRKLFAINEPYLMKTERDALVKMVESEKTETVPSKTTINANRKRTKAVQKKLNYLEQNLSNDTERSLAAKLIDQCLKQITTSALSVTSTTNSTTSPIKRKSPRKNSTSSSFDSESVDSEIGAKLDVKFKDNKKQLLRHLNPVETESNREAQEFVRGLFRNRFESLGYQTKLLCNPFSKVLKVKIGLSTYLIPPYCSFIGIDIIQGIQRLIAEIRSNRSLITNTKRQQSKPFLVVMDPAWENGSVKRKRSYETVSKDYLLRMCRELRILLDIVSSTNSVPYNSPLILTAIWTTKLHKSFVVDEMLPSLGLRARYDLKWHKITNGGCPVKIHGGLEYLIIAERLGDNVTSDASSLRHGLLVSVPSAIHSHKPSVLPIFSQLFGYKNNVHCLTKDSSLTDDKEHEDRHQQRSLIDYSLVNGEIINPLIGVELFARYLQTGFHSIGYECIKLQNEELFTYSDVII